MHSQSRFRDDPKVKDIILRKARSRTAKVVVFGLGHVGLAKAAIIAEASFHVTGVDVNSQIIEAVSMQNIGMNEPGLNELIRQTTKSGHFRATLNGSAAAKEADIIIICVPTPIKEDKTPDLSYIEYTCKTIAHNLGEGKLVIVESTLPPRTTKTFIAPILEEGSGLKCGLDFWLAHCPERITPGKALKEFIENDRIIGGYNTESAEIVAEFFKSFTKGKILTTDATTAEVAKLAENTFRDVNIAYANQLALICELGVDVLEVIKLANTHPRVNIHTPGPGVGGPCLPKDPYLLTYPTKAINYDIITTARQINDYMPKHIIELILQAFTDTRKDIKGSTIATLGTAYKADVDDSRFSPAETVIKELINLGAKPIVYDPYCEESFGARKTKTIEEAVSNADCVVIVTDHMAFKSLNLQEIKKLMKRNPIIVDGRRMVNQVEAENLGFTYHGVGSKRRGTES